MVRQRLASGREMINVLLDLTMDETENDRLIASLMGIGKCLIDKGYPLRLCWIAQGNLLSAKYLAEEGELSNTVDQILSANGKMPEGKAKTLMETEYPRESYVIVKSGAYKGAYIR